MKNKSFVLMLGLLGSVLLFHSCTKNFKEYNTDNTGITNSDIADPGIFLKIAIAAINNFSGGGDPNSYQVGQSLSSDCYSGYFMPATPFAGNKNNLNYNLMAGWNGETNKVLYQTILNNLNIYNNSPLVKAQPALKALSQIVSVKAASRATNIYGPLPYRNIGNKIGNVYDSQKDLYTMFFAQLDSAAKAIKDYNASTNKFKYDALANWDIAYAGDYTNWMKLANSMRLQLAMYIVKIDPQLAKQQAEAAMNPANGGLIEQNSENFVPKVASTPGWTNPLVFLSKNWGDISVNASITSYMNGYKDPRISKYFDKTTDNTFPLQYKGIRIGIDIQDKSNYSGYTTMNYKDGTTPTFNMQSPVILMNAAEVYFLRAEAALRGWANAGGTTQALYETGVQRSFEQWGANVGNYLTDAVSVPEAYVDPRNAANNAPPPSNVTIAWNSADNNEKNLERIITQKWIAMFPDCSVEAWTEFRRTGYPKIFPVVINNSGGTIDTKIQIRRLPFAQKEYNTNKAELDKGIQLLGGPDNGGTRLWWDVNKGNF